MNRDALRKQWQQSLGPAPDGPTPPHIASLTLRFQLYGCDDLREKARVFTEFKRRWGKEVDLAIAEIDDLDSLEYATWSIVSLGPSPQKLQNRLHQVEQAIGEAIDAPVIDVRYEMV
ncbi:DUF503 family protein [Marinobacteraceae bacterium S3BR75-40.1]